MSRETKKCHRSRPAWTLFALLAFASACEAPPALTVPSDRPPPRRLAEACDFDAPDFGDRPFHWLAMDRGWMCENNVAQDRCVFSVPEDCMGKDYQWLGLLDSQDTLTFTRTDLSGENERVVCSGGLQHERLSPFGNTAKSVDRVNVRLKCKNPNGDAGEPIQLQSVLPDTFLRVPSKAPQLVTGAAPADPRAGLIRDVLVVDESELWMVFTGARLDFSDAAIIIRSLSNLGDVRRIELPSANNLSWTKSSSVVVVSASATVYTIDIESKTVKEMKTVSGEVLELAMTPQAESLYVSWASTATRTQSTVERWSMEMPSAVEAHKVFLDLEVTKMLARTSSAANHPAAFIWTVKPWRANSVRDDSLFIMSEDFSEVSKVEVPWLITDIVLIEDDRRIGMSCDHRSIFYEYDYAGQLLHVDALIPLTAMSHAASLHYDAETRRMYVGGFGPSKAVPQDGVSVVPETDGVLTSIDLVTRVAQPERIIFKDAFYYTGTYARMPMLLGLDAKNQRLFPVISNQAYFWDLALNDLLVQ
jgi:hypothetical protein